MLNPIASSHPLGVGSAAVAAGVADRSRTA